jgi:D-xylose transport system permease protein
MAERAGVIDAPADERRPPGGAGAGGMFRFAASTSRAGNIGAMSTVLSLVAIWAIFDSLNSLFLSPGNLYNLSRQISYGGVVSLGLVMVLIVGEVDLSVGSIGGLSAAVLAVLVENDGLNPVLAILVVVLFGALLGVAQSVIFTRFRVPSFVVTLGGLLLFYGLQQRVLGKTGTIRFPFGETIAQIENETLTRPIGYAAATVAVLCYVAAILANRSACRRTGLPDRTWADIALRVAAVAAVAYLVVWELNRVNGVPIAFVLLLALVVVFWVMTTQTSYGQRIYAVGGNAEAARRAGINVTAIKISVFCLSGAAAAFGGIMSGAYVGAASQTLGGDTLLLYAIAAAVIGGTSLFGGRGSAWSALLGWLIIGSIYNGMYLLNVESDVQYMVIGSVLIGAVVLDSLSRRAPARA